MGGGGGVGGVVGHILQEVNTLFRTRFRTWHHPNKKTPVRMTFRDWCLYSSFVLACYHHRNRRRGAASFCSCCSLSELSNCSWSGYVCVDSRKLEGRRELDQTIWNFNTLGTHLIITGLFQKFLLYFGPKNRTSGFQCKILHCSLQKFLKRIN